jgi:hypothetical protein
MDHVLVFVDTVYLVPCHGVGFLVSVTSRKIERRLIHRRYGGRLISYGEYTTNQFFTVFNGVIFSGEAAAAFFSYTTSHNIRHFSKLHFLAEKLEARCAGRCVRAPVRRR